MLVIPAIDLKAGKCVRLKQGRMEEATVYGDDPAAVAQKYVTAGAEWIHVVDLDGSVAGRPMNREAVASIVAAVQVPVELGGGIRHLATADDYIGMGISRLIFGTVALRQPDLFTELTARYPGKIALALDARDGRVAVQGWTEATKRSAVEVAREFEQRGAAVVIFTDIARDGMQTGVNVEATREVAQSLRIPVIASGGLSSLADIDRLRPLEPLGVIGVITGKAVLSGALDLKEAIKQAKG